MSDLGTPFEPGELSFSLPREPSRFIFNVDGDTLFTIHVDGRIERGPKFTTDDEASLLFWELIAERFPEFLDQAIEKRKPA